MTPRPDTREPDRIWDRDGAVTPRPDAGPAPGPEGHASTPGFGSGQAEWVASPPPDPFRPPASALPPPPAQPGSRSDAWRHGGYADQYDQYPTYGTTPAGFPPPSPPEGNTGAGRRGRRRIVPAVAGLVVAALVGGGAGAVVEHRLDHSPGEAASSLEAPVLPRGASNAPTGSVEQVAHAVLPSVVSITVATATQGGEGTGVILSSDGLILTNNHVIAAAADGNGRVTVTLNDGRSASAQIVGRDPTSDLAVIRAQKVTGLQPAALGRSGDLAVGQQVVAIGSPLGLSGTVTSGIVSALNRPVRTGDSNDPQQTTVIEAIQTDAAINPGNSGGPLVNLRGQVVGINSAIATIGQSFGAGQAGNIGVGFAIPIDQARPIADELVKQGHANHPQLGVQVQVGKAAGANPNGGMIAAVIPGGAADKAGLRVNDVVTKVDDQQIDSGDALIAAIRAHRPGDEVTLTYLRGGSSHTTTVTLGQS